MSTNPMENVFSDIVTYCRVYAKVYHGLIEEGLPKEDAQNEARILAIMAVSPPTEKPQEPFFDFHRPAGEA